LATLENHHFLLTLAASSTSTKAQFSASRDCNALQHVQKENGLKPARKMALICKHRPRIDGGWWW
jgi:hypothetical protein